MERKLVKQGATTLMISVPSAWARQHKLRKGGSVSLRSVGNTLLISPSSVAEKSEVILSLPNESESVIRTLITNAYRAGHDRVLVNLQENMANQQYLVLRSIVQTRLLGFELSRKNKSTCVIENVTEPSEDQFEPLLLKMLYNVTRTLELGNEWLKGMPVNEEVEDVSLLVQKYDNFCRRVITKQRIALEQPELFWTFLAIVVHGQRELYQMMKQAPRKNKEKNGGSKAVQELLGHTSRCFEFVKKAFVEKRIEYLEEVHRIHEEIVLGKAEEILSSAKESERVVVHHLLTALREFYLSMSPLSGLFMKPSLNVLS